MFKHILYILVLTLVLPFNITKAQVAKDRCSTDKYMQIKLAENPQLEQAIKQTTEEAKNWAFQNKNKSNKNSRPLLTIPVVVHVIYNEAAPEDNISMDQIASQLEVLNQDYQLTNMDRNNVPAIFQNVVANVDIEFCLASTDPTGAFTEGVTRTKTDTVATFDLETDQIKRPELGGVAPWNRNYYLNIWVGRLEEDVLGYSSSPGFRASIDGVAISTRYFGKGSQYNLHPSYNKGRTTTHEVGHWLGLKHTWGNSEENGCDFDDGLEDTPNSSEPYYMCPLLSNSVSCGSQDMTMNFMEYVNDACMYMFTKDQKDRIHGVLNTTRKSLFDSNGCQNLNFDVDAGISVTSLVENYCGSSYPLEVNITNVGQNLISTLNIVYSINGGDTFPFNKTLNLNPGETETLMLGNVNIAGENSMDISITLVNGVEDQNLDNNNITFSVITPAFANIPLIEGFERADSFEQDGWRSDNPDMDEFDWRIFDENGAPPAGSSSLIYNNFSGDSINNPRNTLDHLISPALDLSLATTVSFMFDRAYARYDNQLFDGLRLSYSTDCGNNWKEFWYKENKDLATNPFDMDGGDPFFPAIEDWETETIDLPELAGQKEVLFRITNVSGWGQLLWLDNIKVDATISTSIDFIDQQAIQTYPNPSTNGKVVVAIPNTQNKKHQFNLLNIYNTFGQLISSQPLQSTTERIEIDLGEQPSGVYLLEAINKEGLKNINRLILTK